ncbi:ribonuclease H-like domain-containing protein [Tanacetum coccineum]
MESQSETTQTMSTLKLPVLKTGEYDLWSMRMEQYHTFTNHSLWVVIVNGDSVSPIASASAGAEAIPDEHLLKFYACKDAKSLWEAIKNSQEGLDKTYDSFQKLISQLEIHGEVISQEDANLKLLRSLPSARNNIALIKRNKSDLDTLSMDDLYNNLKVYESEIKGKSSSSPNSQNVAFISLNNSSNTNETFNTTHSVSAASFKDQASTISYANDVMFSFFANQSNALQLDYEYLEQIDADDLEEMDLKWKVAMLTMRVKRFIKKTGRKIDLNDKETVGFDRTKVECYNCHRRCHFARECRAPKNQGNRNRDAPRRNAPVDTSTINAFVVQDGIGYQMGLESLEARLVVHEKNEAVYEEDIAFLKYDVQVKDISIKDLKNQLEEALKDKDISAKDKTGLGYDSQMNKSEVLHNVFNSRESDVDDSPVNDRFKTNDSIYKTKVSKIETSISKTGKDIIEKPKTIRPSAPIIKEWDTNSDQTKPKFTKINFVKSGKNVKSLNKENTHRQVEYPRKSQSPRDNRRNWNGIMTQKLGNGFESIKKACFVCGSLNHLIKDCDFHEIKMVEKLVLNNKGRVTGQREIHAAKQCSPRAATSISTARPVNIAAPKPKVNDALPIAYSYFKAHSPVRRDFNQKSAAKTNNFNEKVNTARVNNVTTAGPKAVVSAAEGNGENIVKSSACWIWRPTGNVIDHTSKDSGSYMLKRFDYVDLQGRLNGCSRHMTGNKSFLTAYKEIDGGFVAFGESPKRGKITGKGKIRTSKLDFEDVYFVKELKLNLFFVSQMCNKKTSVLFTETECLVLSPDFKLVDESQVLLKVPIQNNMYSFDLMNVVLSGGLTCLFAKATIDDSNLWHRRLGHINFKTMNKLVKGNLDETSGILKTFITGFENQINHKVKIIRCDNGTEFKNNDMNQFCGMKGNKREFSVSITPQQNRVVERKNKTLIEAARTMLADLLLPNTFWAEAVNTASYVQNRVLVTKPHNKTPYELLHGRPPSISFMRPFGCPVTILNTLDPLGKFDGKADEGFLVGYSINSKAFRVFNTRTRKVDENLHINFLENKPNVAGSGLDWPFDIDLLTNLLFKKLFSPFSRNEAIYEEWAEKVGRATATTASLDATHASGNISKTQSTTMSYDLLSQEIGSGGNTPGSDEERIKQDDLTDFVPPTPYDLPLSGGHTPGSDKGRPNINELMAICTNLSNRVLALEQSKTTQDLVIRKLKKKVRKFKKKLRARTPGMKLFKIGISKRKSLDEEYVSKQGRKSDKTKPMFDDSDFAELDVDNAMENVEGDAETQGRNTSEQITTNGYKLQLKLMKS